MTGDKRPIIAITIGDPAGIGPEVVVKALANKAIYDMCRPLVIGESATLRAAIELIKKPLNIHAVDKALTHPGNSAELIFWICITWTGLRSKQASFPPIADGQPGSLWKKQCNWRLTTKLLPW